MTGCPGLHSPKVSCLECGTPEAPSVSDIYAWMRLEQSIVCLYKGDVETFGPEPSIDRAAATCGVSRRFIVKTLKKHKVIA